VLISVFLLIAKGANAFKGAGFRFLVTRPERIPIEVVLQELAQARLRSIVENLLRRATRGNRAVIDENHCVGDLRGKTRFVRHDDHRHAIVGAVLHDCIYSVIALPSASKIRVVLDLTALYGM
jgi:hypothetical protein